jgi:hypothetical protein
LLLEHGGEAPKQVGIGGVLPLHVLDQELHEAHLCGQEAGRGELRNEAAAGMGAEEQIGVDVVRIRDVAGPAPQRLFLVGFDPGPILGGDAERPPQVGDPASQQSRPAPHHELGEGGAQLGAVVGGVRKADPAGVGRVDPAHQIRR